MKVLFIAAYPIQNAEPDRLFAQMEGVDMLVLFCSDPGENLVKDKEFINQQQFDIKVLDDKYPWKIIKNISPKPGLSKFWGLINPSVIPEIIKMECVVVYGHAYITFWMAILASLFLRKKLILTTDATYLESPDKKSWKERIKSKMIPFLYNNISDLVWVPSTEAKRFLIASGVKQERIIITPYTVDNNFIVLNSNSNFSVRTKFNIPLDATVAVFCAKFIERKRPQDAIRAFALANCSNCYLLMIGDGPLKLELISLVSELGLDTKVIFAGLVNYSQLPSYYASSDFLVFTSETEQFGLPVNEAMLCGLPVLISDRIGCRYDLVQEGGNGFTYKCGNVSELSEKMKMLFDDTALRQQMSIRSKEIIKDWSPASNATAKYNSITELLKR
ncbi:MAG: glycosyltransferase family 4 protein [Opitutaceae bacterium]|nr:glycosyltransferase family 4 protein [Cytophagales bacterium]